MGRPKKQVEKPVIPNGKKLTLNVKCRHCQFFKTGAIYLNPAKSEQDPRERIPCSELGVQGEQLPCVKFSVDPKMFSFDSEDEQKLAELLCQIPPKQIVAFAALINEQKETRSQGVHFGETVYVHLFGGDYLSNYAKAYVVKATKDIWYLRGSKGWTGAIQPRQILKEIQFQEKRKYLKANGKLKDPDIAKYTNLGSRSKINYETKTIDDYFSEEKKSKKKSKGNSFVVREEEAA